MKMSCLLAFLQSQLLINVEESLFFFFKYGVDWSQFILQCIFINLIAFC